MSVLITCVCGHQRKAPEGRPSRCRACGHVQTAEAADAQASAPETGFTNWGARPQTASVVPAPAAGPQPKPRRPLSRKECLALGGGLVLAALLLWLLWPSQAKEPFTGTWVESTPAEPREVAMSFGKDGGFEASVHGKALSGQWKTIVREGPITMVEVFVEGEKAPRLVKATTLDDGRLQVSFSADLGTFLLAPTMYSGGQPTGGMVVRPPAGGNSGRLPINTIRPSPASPPPPPAGGSDDSGANYSQIEDRLWMGGTVKQPPAGTKAVVNVCSDNDSYSTPAYLWASIPDSAPAPSIGWLSRMVKFVGDHRSSGETTYVHCHAGISRSGLVTVAYIMSEHHMGRDDALAFVRRHRPQAKPNQAFMDLLAQWEQVVLP